MKRLPQETTRHHTLRHLTAVHLGHPHLPEIPLGTIDVGWMPIVAERNGVAIRRDRRIHTRPLEVRVFSDVGLRTMWLGGKKDMGSRQQLDLVTRHWQTFEDRRRELGPAPWSVTLPGGGRSPRVWRPET